MKRHIHISASGVRGPSLLLSTDMYVWQSQKISCIFDDIDRMATNNADFEISREVLEKIDVVLHLNAV